MQINRPTIGVLFLILISSVILVNSRNSGIKGEESFTIIMLPDTQNAIDFTKQKKAGFAIDGRDIYLEQMRYIASRSVKNGGNVVFVASVGDVW